MQQMWVVKIKKVFNGTTRLHKINTEELLKFGKKGQEVKRIIL